MQYWKVIDNNFSTAAPKLNVPPRFRDTAFFDKGENVVIKIPFTGFPKPKISWYRGTEHIESGGHYHVEVKVCIIYRWDCDKVWLNIDVCSMKLCVSDSVPIFGVLRICTCYIVHNHFLSHLT